MPEPIRTARVSLELTRGQGHIQGFVQDPVWGRHPFYGWLQLGTALDRARSVTIDDHVDRPVHLLAIDGGGVRGLIPALILSELEARTGRGCAELFDLFAGTGTGGIVALALTMIRGGSDAPWRAADMVDFFMQQGPSIFAPPASPPPAPTQPPPPTTTLAAGQLLDAALTTYFGEQTLACAVKPVIVTAYDLSRHEPLTLSSRRAVQDRSWDLPAWSAARATAAAPTLFAPLELRLGPGGHDRLLADGGLYANNPALFAYAEAEQTFPGPDLRLLSLGTGETVPPTAWTDVHKWSPAQWARPLFQVAVDGVSRDVHAHLSTVLDLASYWRIQLPLRSASAALDDASTTNLAHLREHGQRLIRHFDRELDAACHSLTT
jgi:patatin-like phospholipase/acyl hydrolase